MNNLSFQSLYNSSVQFMPKQTFGSLTIRQEQIAAVVALAFSFLAACYVIYRCFSAHPIIPAVTPFSSKGNGIPQPLPSNTGKPRQTQQPVKTPQNFPNSHPLRIQFEQIIQQTMGNHITAVQKHTLMQLFDQAIQTNDPQDTLKQLIDSKTNQPDGWGFDKANHHIKRHLLPLMPGNRVKTQNPTAPQNCQNQVQQIAQAPIDAQGNKLVCFYKTGPTEFLGNFAHCPNGVTIWGKRFNCSEAAFQWQKYVQAGINDPLMNQFFTADGEAAFRLNRSLGHKYPTQFPPNWRSGARDTVMWHVLQAKFQQNPSLKTLLDDTKGAYLLEHNQANRDDYWSDNSDGSGKNMLGKHLMAIREGKPQPPVDDNSNTHDIIYFAQYANSGRLNYQIF